MHDHNSVLVTRQFLRMKSLVSRQSFQAALRLDIKRLKTSRRDACFAVGRRVGNVSRKHQRQTGNKTRKEMKGLGSQNTGKRSNNQGRTAAKKPGASQPNLQSDSVYTPMSQVTVMLKYRSYIF